jgi:hypothetical protein
MTTKSSIKVKARLGGGVGFILNSLSTLLVSRCFHWNNRHNQKKGEGCGHTKPGGANVLVSRSSRGSECLRTVSFPPNSVKEEVRPFRGPEAREDSRSTNIGC